MDNTGKHDDSDNLQSMNHAAEVMTAWSPPSNWPVIRVIDAHTEGEPLRVIVSGYPTLHGSTILERRREAKRYHDVLRTALMWEPRGHADMYGCLITPPVTAGADFGVLFMHNEGYSTMCGHGIIAVTKVALETGLLPRHSPTTQVTIDTPAGLVVAYADVVEGRVQRVRFRNVPSFAYALDQFADVPGLGALRYDIAFGGAFYAYVQASDVGLTCTPENYGELIKHGKAIKQAVTEQANITHPVETDLGFLYGAIFIGAPEAPDAHSRNVCVFAEGEVDRSPTGTGVSGRAALHYARGEVKKGESLIIESIIGSRFVVRVAETVPFGPFDAIIPEVEGRAYITGCSAFCLDPDDPLTTGFILR